MTMRSRQIRVLLNQQAKRMRKHPAAIALLVLTLGIALLVSTSDWLGQPQAGAARPATYWLVYDSNSSWIEHLRAHPPEGFEVEFINSQRVPEQAGERMYPPGDHAIELSQGAVPGSDPVHVAYRFSGASESVLYPFTRWFWKETAGYFGVLPVLHEQTRPVLTTRQQAARNTLQNTSVMDVLTPGVVATLLLFGVQYFSCTHLFVSFLAQDRERGTLLAMALTPASLVELLTARFLFHLIVSISVSALVLAILAPQALLQPLMWLLIVTCSLGFLSVGTLIGTMSRTQNTAGLMTLCYMLAGAIVYYLASRYPLVGLVKMLSFEHYGFPLMFHSVAGKGLTSVAIELYGRMLLLVGFWVVLAARMFRRHGWQ